MWLPRLRLTFVKAATEAMCIDEVTDGFVGSDCEDICLSLACSGIGW